MHLKLRLFLMNIFVLPFVLTCLVKSGFPQWCPAFESGRSSLKLSCLIGSIFKRPSTSTSLDRYLRLIEISPPKIDVGLCESDTGEMENNTNSAAMRIYKELNVRMRFCQSKTCSKCLKILSGGSSGTKRQTKTKNVSL